MEIHSVEWLSVSPEAIAVHVNGARDRDVVAQAPVLLVRGPEGRVLSFEAATCGDAEGASGLWSASFSVPIELRPYLTASLQMQVNGLELALPAAIPGAALAAVGGATARVIESSVLEQRRARRVEQSDHALLRRAQIAEATGENLSRQVSNLEARLEETARERDGLRERIAQERAEETRRGTELDAAAAQLAAQVERVGVAAVELTRLKRLLDARHAAAEPGLAALERERDRARREADGLDRRVGRLAGELLERRDGALADARRITELGAELERMRKLARQLGEAAGELRGGFQAEVAAQRAEFERRLEGERERHAGDLADERRRNLERLLAIELRVDVAQRELESLRERMQAEEAGLKEELARIRGDSRPAGAGDIESSEPAQRFEPATVTPPAVAERPAPGAMPLAARELAEGTRKRRTAWLAPAIRRVAERRDAKLAGDLIGELLSAQGLIFHRRLRYVVDVAQSGRYLVEIDSVGASATRLDPVDPEPGDVDFKLSGDPGALAELAGGGGSRRLRHVQRSGSRRRLRRLLRRRRRPVALGELAQAGVRLWPGLLMLALAEAIDPAWTAGESFTLELDVAGEAPASIYVTVADGAPIGVTHEPPTLAPPLVVLHASERAILSLFGGVSHPEEETIWVSGDGAALERFLGWSDRAQGLV